MAKQKPVENADALSDQIEAALVSMMKDVPASDLESRLAIVKMSIEWEKVKRRFADDDEEGSFFNANV